MIKKGTSNIANVKKSNDQVTRVYLGSDILWENWRPISGSNLLAQNITLSTITATASTDRLVDSSAIQLASPYAGCYFRNPVLSVTHQHSHSSNESWEGMTRFSILGVKEDNSTQSIYSHDDYGNGTDTYVATITNNVPYKAIIIRHEAYVFTGNPGSYSSRITAGIMTACEVKA